MPSEQSAGKGPSRFATLTKYLVRYKRYLILGGISVMGANGLLLVNPYLTKVIFDRLENKAPMSEVGLLVLAMVGLAICAGICRFAMRRTIIWMSRWIEYDLRSELVEHLMTLSPSFYDKNRTGDIMARATNDLEAVRQLTGPAIMQISNTLVVATGAITMMVILSPRLTLYSLIPALLLPIVMNRLGNLVHRKFVKIQEHFSAMTAMAQENLAGVRLVKAYRQEGNESDHFASLSREYFRLNLGMGMLHAAFFPAIQFVAAGLALVVLYYGGMDVINGEIELSTIVAFFLYLGMLTWPLMAIGWVVSLYQRGTASLDRINSVLRTEPEIANRGSALRRETIQGKIEFRNLSFAYNDTPVLTDINLTLESGQTLGIVGMTGSGKTTLVSLIAHLYPIEQGQLFIDDVDINDWDLARLRGQVGFVAQEPFLFSATMAENIRFGSDNGEMEFTREMAQTAALAKDIESFPAKYETTVGERGITLSGGQKQRTAIARAIMIDPSILILDDATASVDAETEFEINERIRARTRQLTTLIVSHRISSVKSADVIIYLDNGHIVEQGTHEELIALGGNYAGLYHSQLLAEELENL